MPWDHEHEEVVEALRAELERRLKAMGPEASVPAFEGRDADLVFHALAFWALHAWWEDFEDLLTASSPARTSQSRRPSSTRSSPRSTAGSSAPSAPCA